MSEEFAKPFACDTCAFSTYYQKALDGHLLSRHGKSLDNRDVHRCVVCPYATVYPRSLRNHMETHTRINLSRRAESKAEVRLHKCPDCYYETKKLNHLKRHRPRCAGQKRAPNRDATFKCTFCDFTTKWSDSLEAHIGSGHYGNQDSQDNWIERAIRGHQIRDSTDDKAQHRNPEKPHASVQDKSAETSTSRSKSDSGSQVQGRFASTGAQSRDSRSDSRNVTGYGCHQCSFRANNQIWLVRHRQAKHR